MLHRTVEAGRGLVVVGLGTPVVSEGSQCPRSGEQGTDFMSRGAPLPVKWWLHPTVVEQIWEWFGKSGVDLFATYRNPLPTLIIPCRRKLHRKLLCAFPPLCLVPHLLERVRLEQLPVILVTPDHRSAPLHMEMTHMLVNLSMITPFILLVLSYSSSQKHKKQNTDSRPQLIKLSPHEMHM